MSKKQKQYSDPFTLGDQVYRIGRDDPKNLVIQQRQTKGKHVGDFVTKGFYPTVKSLSIGLLNLFAVHAVMEGDLVNSANQMTKAVDNGISVVLEALESWDNG